MLPYLAASGHNMYTKSARVYLQQITDLKPEHPDVQQRFDDGFDAIRRSDRQSAGLSSDLIIEQVIMRGLKRNDGLTRGRGMTEHQRLVWLLSMPTCAEINQAMQELTEVNYNTVDQNKVMSEARQTRDWKDTSSSPLSTGSKPITSPVPDEALDMSWTVEHSSNASHGLAGLHTDASSISTLNM